MCARDKDALKVAQACTNVLLVVVPNDDDDGDEWQFHLNLNAWKGKAEAQSNQKRASYTHSLTHSVICNLKGTLLSS